MKLDLPWDAVEGIMIAVLKDEITVLEKANENIRAMPCPCETHQEELLSNGEIIDAMETLLAYYGVKP